MKVFAWFLLTSSILWSCLGEKDTQTYYVKYVKCNFSMEYYFPNHTCYAKSFNRSCSTATIVFESIRPVDTVYLGLILNYKYGTIYREVMNIKPFEVCQFNRKGTTNIVTKFLTDMLEDSAPGIFHPCPYKKFNVTNARVKTSTIGSAFATGDYKSLFSFTDANQKHMFTILFYASVNSSEKHSFG